MDSRRRLRWLSVGVSALLIATLAPVALTSTSQASVPTESERVTPRAANDNIPLGEWTPMGIEGSGADSWQDPGLNQAVYALAKYKGQIYAGGLFDDTGGGGVTSADCSDDAIFALQCIAVWSEDDTAWRPVGPGFNNSVDSLVVMDDTLYVGGTFDDTVGGVGDVDKECAGNVTGSGVSWTAQTAASDDSWSSVVWGRNQTGVPVLVAVASGGDDTRVMTSPDGVTWSSPSGPVPVNDWQSVAWGGNGIYVAVGSSGDDSQVMTSPDGIAWTPRAATSDDSWSSVTYGRGNYVAVASSGDDSRVMFANDEFGVRWYRPLVPVPVNDWQSVAFGDDTFVAVASSGDDSQVMTSSDENLTWTARKAATNNTWQSVAFGNSTFVAVASSGDDSQVMTSPNGVTWTPQAAASDDSWSSVTFGNGTFVAVASSGDDSQVMTSPNGVTWTLRDSPAANAWQSVTWGLAGYFPDTFVAVGSKPTSSQVMRSALTWSPDPLGCIAAWNGGAWSPVSLGLNGKADALAVLGDDTLLVAGDFIRAGSLGPPNSSELGGLAAWSDGTWTAPGVGGFQTAVYALVADGPTTAYVGGQYQGDGADDSGIMRMTGSFGDSRSWSPMSTGFSWPKPVTREVQPGAVDALAILDDTVYAGGYFDATGNRDDSLYNFASWNGTSWQTVGPGLNDRFLPGARRPTSVRALAVDDTRGLLYVGGTFDDTPGGYGNGQCDDTAIPGGPLRCVTVWDSAIEEFIPFQWGSADDSNGLTGEVSSFVVDDSVVYVGGRFNTYAEGGFPYQWNLKNVGKWTWNPPTGLTRSVTSGLPSTVVDITASAGLIGVSSVRFFGTSNCTGPGTNAASVVRHSSTSLTATVPNVPPGNYGICVDAVGGVVSVGSFTVTSPTPPSPTPPSPPRDVTATAGDASATITWRAPESAGSYPVTDYEVTSSSGGRTCLVAVTTCTITGLTNGTSYTFTVRALSGADWSAASAPSNAVIPSAEPPPPSQTIQITGTRSAAKVTVSGSTTGFGMGGMVTAHTRTARGTPYTPGSTALVSTSGTFDWSRGISKRKTLWVYFTGGDAKSNILRLAP